MYLFVQAVLAPHCCPRISGERGLLPSCGGGAAYCQGFSGGGTWALGRADFSSGGCGSGLVRRFLGSGARAPQLRCVASWLCGMWDLPGPGRESVSAALAGGFLSVVPLEKSLLFSSEPHWQDLILHGKHGGFICAISFVLCPSTFQALISLRCCLQLLPRNPAGQVKPCIQAADWSQRPWPWAALLCSNPSHLHSATIKAFRSLGRFLPLMIT